MVPAAQRAEFLAAAEALGTPADVAHQAIFNKSLAAAILTSIVSTTSDDAPPPGINAAACPAGSHQHEHSLTTRGRNFLGQVLWTTAFHKIWCYNGNPLKVPGKHTRVTRIIRVNAVPNTTAVGAVAGWKWEGLVPGSSDSYFFNATSFNAHSGHHSFREGHWAVCPIGQTCFDNVYPRLNMNVFWNGTYQYWQGPDSNYP